MKQEIHHAIGYRFMSAAFEVYNEQGQGLGEEIYQESLEIELGPGSIAFSSKTELRCHYKGRELKSGMFLTSSSPMPWSWN